MFFSQCLLFLNVLYINWTVFTVTILVFWKQMWGVTGGLLSDLLLILQVWKKTFQLHGIFLTHFMFFRVLNPKWSQFSPITYSFFAKHKESWPNNSAPSLEGPKSLTRSISSLWKNGWGPSSTEKSELDSSWWGNVSLSSESLRISSNLKVGVELVFLRYEALDK